MIAPLELHDRAGLLLDELLRKDLVVPEWSAVRGEDGFRFRHILIRDATYEAIPKVDRAAMHEQFAAWLMDVYLGRAARWTRSSATTCKKRTATAWRSDRRMTRPAPLADRAAGHLLAAGDRALDRNDFHGAMNLLGRAHALSNTPGADLLLAYGSALAHGGSLNHALDTIRRAVEAAEVAGDTGLAWHARIEELSWRAQVDTGAGVSTEILATVPDAVQRFEHLGDDSGAARLGCPSHRTDSSVITPKPWRRPSAPSISPNGPVMMDSFSMLIGASASQSSGDHSAERGGATLWRSGGQNRRWAASQGCRDGTGGSSRPSSVRSKRAVP